MDGANDRLIIDSDGHFTLGGNITAKRGVLIPGSGAYDQLKIANVTTADTNKLAGIYTLNYAGNNTSIMQYSSSTGNNTVYYGSADGNYRGLTQHIFYVNSAIDTASSGHTEILRLKSDLTTEFAGRVGIGEAPAAGIGLHVDGAVRIDSTDGLATRQIRANYFSNGQDLTFTTGTTGEHKFISNGATQVWIGDGFIYPETDSDVDLGKSDKYFKNAYIDTITTTGAVTVGDVINMPNNKGVTWTGGSIRVESNVLKLVGDSGIQLQDTTTITGGTLHLGTADTASGHINAYEVMTFNIDTDNDDTNRYFAWYTNGSDGSGTELLKILETGAATFAGRIKQYGADTQTNVTASSDLGIELKNTSNTDGNFIPIDFFNSTGYVTGRIGAEFQDAGDRNTDLYFCTRANSGSLTEALRIDSSQNATFKVPNNGGITIDSADVGTLKFLGSGSVHNWGLVSTKAAAGDFGIYKSNSAGGDPNTAGTAQLYFTNAGNATFTGDVTGNSGFYPDADGGAEVGNASLKFSGVYTNLLDAENIKVNGGQGSDGQVLTSTGSGVAWEAVNATFAGGTITNSILIDYTGDDGNGNDAGLKVQNDGSDWGIYVRKDSAANFGLRIDSGGANAFQIAETVGGSPSFRIGGDGDIEVVKNIVASGTIDASGDITATGNSRKIRIVNTSSNEAVQLLSDGSGDGQLRLNDSSGTTKILLYGEASAINYINNGGNFGVGTATPGAKLNVFTGGNSIAAAAVLQHDTFATDRKVGLGFELGNTQIKAAIGFISDASSPGTYGRGNLIFCVDSVDDDAPVSHSDEKLRISHTGVATFAGNIMPDGDADADLGSASYRWNKLYIGTGIYGTGNAITIRNDGGSWLTLNARGINIGDWDDTAGYGEIRVGTYDFKVIRDDDTSMFTIAEPSGNATFLGTVTATGGNSTNWNTAYGWGNHASAGYLTSVPSNASALNLNATDDRDMAPEDLSYSDDMRIFFSAKEGLEDGTSTGSDWHDVLLLNSYSDSSGGNANILAFDKNSYVIRHYQAGMTASNWGTAKTLAYLESPSFTGTATFGGNITASGTNNVFNTGNSGTFDTSDANSYPRITISGGSAQLGLFRSSSAVGGVYIGADSGGFDIRNESFATLFQVSQSGNVQVDGDEINIPVESTTSKYL